MARIIIILFFIINAEFVFAQYPNISPIPLQQEFCNTKNTYLTNIDFYETYWQKQELEFWEKGLILNDSLLYLQKIANRLNKQENKSLPSLNFKIYLLKSTRPEVFSFPNGNIYLSVGCVLNLKNEQELLFLIIKEISKNIISSNKNNFLEKDSLEKRAGKYSKLIHQEGLLIQKKIEKDLSLTEDSLAISILKTNNLLYPQKIKGFLLRCPYPNLPPFDEPINFSIFDSKEYKNFHKFKNYSPQKNEINPNYNDDFLASYNSGKRINYLNQFLFTANENIRSSVCDNCFETLRKEAFKLNISLLMNQNQYKEALYFLMSDKIITQKNKLKIGVCIHNIAIEKRDKNVNDKFYLSGVGKVNYWLNKSTPYEIALLNLNYQFKSLLNNPNSIECDYLFTNSLNEFTKFYPDSIKINNIAFYKYSNLEENIELLRQNIEITSIQSNNPKVVFYELLQDELFFEKASTFLIDWKNRRLSYKPKQKIELNLKPEDLNFEGKTNYSIVNLNYLSSDFNFKVMPKLSCENYNILKSIIDNFSSEFQNELYCSQTLDTSKLEINSWQNQLYWVNDFYKKNKLNFNSEFISYPISQLEDAKKWNTKYLLYTTNQIIEVEKSKLEIALASVGSLVSIFWPITIPYLIKKQNRSKYSFCIYDVMSKKVVYKNEVSIEKKITGDILKQTFYQDLDRIKEKL